MQEHETAQRLICQAQAAVMSVLVLSDVPPLRSLYCPRYLRELVPEVVKGEDGYYIKLRVPKERYAAVSYSHAVRNRQLFRQSRGHQAQGGGVLAQHLHDADGGRLKSGQGDLSPGHVNPSGDGASQPHFPYRRF